MKKLQKISKKGKDKYQIHQETVVQKYSSIIYMSTKTLRKEAKVVKSFECQKVVRKIKDYKSSESFKEQHNFKIKELEETLKKIKALDLDVIVQACISRCGFANKLYSLSTDDDANDHMEKRGKKENEVEQDEYTTKLIKDMIQHKKMASLIQSIRIKLSEFNTWLAKEEEWLAGKKIKDGNATGRGQKRSRNEYSSVQNDIFIGSLANGDESLEDADGNALYEEGDNNYDGVYTDNNIDEAQIVKKNRMGQRQRKAKAKALEAQNKGRLVGKEQSLNWRPKKQKKDEKNRSSKPKEESASGLDKTKAVKVADVANMGKSWKEDGKAHPSWAAREAQKAKSSGVGMVEFTGKKITFD